MIFADEDVLLLPTAAYCAGAQVKNSAFAPYVPPHSARQFFANANVVRSVCGDGTIESYEMELGIAWKMCDTKIACTSGGGN
jgi:hypothetical protein